MTERRTDEEIYTLWEAVMEAQDQPRPAATVLAFARRVEAEALEQAAQECEARAIGKDGSAEHYVRSCNPSIGMAYHQQANLLRELAVAIRALAYVPQRERSE